MHGRTESIVSNRLTLQLIGLEVLRCFACGDRSGARKNADFVISDQCPLFNLPRVGKRLQLIDQDADQHAWMYRAIINQANNTMVGYISFHHQPPDPDLSGYFDPALGHAVELGYAIEPDQRRNGFATEAVKAMMSWAYSHKKIRSFILTIGHRNVASLAMAEHLGFRKIGTRMDDVDGLEYVYHETHSS